jgi:hypothetical protein
MYTIRSPRRFRAGGKFAVLLMAALAVSVVAFGLPAAGRAAADSPTTGTWALYPEQTYTVYANINGTNVEKPAVFYLM